MVTAKTIGGDGIDTYGMAIPAGDLRAFLTKNYKGKLPAPTNNKSAKKSVDWEAVDERVSSSVVMVIKAQ
jgi:hypothetical protein